MSLPKKIAFVDIETTGGSLRFDRIIEIGIIVVEDGKIRQTYQTLVNPGQHLPPEIVALTGISSRDLDNSPKFREIKDDLLQLFEGCVFVAHNVRFDYGFIKTELRRLNTSFSHKHFCTVKLSRYLFPRYKHHNLDALIERFNLHCPRRHRALDDANCLWQFFQIIKQNINEQTFEKAVSLALKKPSLPIQVPTQVIETLPETSGVYIFYGKNGLPLYIGKSINIKERVKSHFVNDHHLSLEMKISQQLESIETIVTPGELGALLTEASLIKRLQPLYNRKLRTVKQLTILRKEINPDGYLSIQMDEANTLQPENLPSIVGVFKTKKQAKEYLLELAKKQKLCEKILKVDSGISGACFGYRLGRCKGACIKKELPQTYNLRSILAFSKLYFLPWPFKGAIMLEERNSSDESREFFLLDKWCYLGSIKSSGEKNILNPQEICFDLDTYRILSGFLKSKKSRLTIKEIDSAHLQAYLA